MPNSQEECPYLTKDKHLCNHVNREGLLGNGPDGIYNLRTSKADRCPLGLDLIKKVPCFDSGTLVREMENNNKPINKFIHAVRSTFSKK